MQSLEGIKVLNLSVNLPGPLAGGLLAQKGASVTKIEPPSGDPMEMASREFYQQLTVKQKVRRLDLKNQNVLKDFLSELEHFDVFLTSFRESALKKMSLDQESLKARYPRLIQVGIQGYETPEENRPGHDLNFQATWGVLNPPQLPRLLLADYLGAERAAFEVVTLLFKREREKSKGLCSQVYLAEVLRDWREPLRFGLTKEGGLLGGGHPYYGIFKTQEGWLALGALEDSFQKRLNSAFDLQGDEGELQELFLKKTAKEWEEWGEKHDVPLTRVKD